MVGIILCHGLRWDSFTVVVWATLVLASCAAGSRDATGGDDADGGASVAGASGDVLPGDTNRDGMVNITDAMQICMSGKYGTGGNAGWEEGDFNGDGKVDLTDLTVWFANSVSDGTQLENCSEFSIESISANLLAGDTNLDGTVNRQDMEQFCAAGKYKSENAATWAEGDFTGDGAVGFDDLTVLFANYLDENTVFEGCSAVDSFEDVVSELVPGDADLNGVVNSDDVALICEAGKYGTEELASWSEGDYNGDGKFDFDDVLAFFPEYQEGGSSESTCNWD